MKTFTTTRALKKMFKAVSEEDYTFKNLFIDASKKAAIATNGHYAVAHPVDNATEDLFLEKLRFEDKATNEAVYAIASNDAKFPDVVDLFFSSDINLDSTPKEYVTVRLTAKYLKDIANLAETGDVIHLSFEPTNESTEPIFIKFEKAKHKVVLMPCRKK